MLTDKRVVVTGGTGSLGQALVRRLLEGDAGLPAEVVVFSRSEALQHEMRQSALLQAMTHGQAGLAAADHQGMDAFGRHQRRAFLTAGFCFDAFS